MCAFGGTPSDTEGADRDVRESVSRSPCEFREEMGHDWATGDDPQLIRLCHIQPGSGSSDRPALAEVACAQNRHFDGAPHLIMARTK